MMGLPPDTGGDGTERLWVDDDVTRAGGRAAEFALVSLGFIRAALRRSAWFWRVTAIVGLVAGAGLYLASPHAHQASTTLLLTVGPESVPGTAILDDQAIAHSRSVAGLAIHKLGLRESVDGLLGSYTVTVVTDRVLTITVSAPSSNEAVSQANTLATEFLAFRATELQALQQLGSGVLNQQVTRDKQQVKSISAQISQLSAQPVSSSQQAALNALRTQRDHANNDLTMLAEAASTNQAATQVTTSSMVGESKVLDPASPLKPASRVKHLALYVAAGFILGLLLGVSIVVIRALISDRLRRRDDVAYALGAPVKLSVGTIRVGRLLPGRRGLAAADGQDVRRIVGYLGKVVPPRSRGAAALAVVPVGDPRVAALALASLALGCAEGIPGSQVILADLCPGAPAGRLLGVTHPGIHDVSVNDVQLGVAVADPDDAVPVGPLGGGPGIALPDHATEPLAAACASADILLTLASLDPSLGGEHLPSWANAAVVVVTAGRSSFTKIHAVGEMIRLAGIPLVSAVLVGADKTDESLGVTPTPEADGNAFADEGLHDDEEGSVVPVNGVPDGRPSGDSPVARFTSR
jgi:capsular polysaccharide biosynthesis protein